VIFSSGEREEEEEEEKKRKRERSPLFLLFCLSTKSSYVLFAVVPHRAFFLLSIID
jgi:hypothetical protein